MAAALLELPESLRPELKEPLGPVFSDTKELLDTVDGPLVAVGDIVAHHLHSAGRIPDLTLYDERTEREPVEEEITSTLDDGDVTVHNPAGTLTAALLEAITDGIQNASPITIRVNGEEDLAALPTILAAPDGASVVYGQPGEGMVHVRITAKSRDRARDLITRMDGDSDQALAILSAR